MQTIFYRIKVKIQIPIQGYSIYMYISQWEIRDPSKSERKKCKICQGSYQSWSIYGKIEGKWSRFNLHMLSLPLVMRYAEEFQDLLAF